MEVRAGAKYVGISSLKLCLVADRVRGKKVDEVLALLKLFPTPATRAVAKVIKSAAANAENNFQMAPAQLRIVEIVINQGSTLKRARPQARGRVNPILRHSSHIAVVVNTEE